MEQSDEVFRLTSQSARHVSPADKDRDTEKTPRKDQRRLRRGCEIRKLRGKKLRRKLGDGWNRAPPTNSWLQNVQGLSGQDGLMTQLFAASSDVALGNDSEAAQSDETQANLTNVDAGTSLPAPSRGTADSTYDRGGQPCLRNEVAKASQATEQLDNVRFSFRAEFSAGDLDENTAREAHRIYDDDEGVARKYIFIWLIGKEGMLVATVTRPDQVHLILEVQKVQIAVNREPCRDVPFTQSSDNEMRPVITVPLAASLLKSPKLSVPCRWFGTVKDKYIVLNFIVKLAPRKNPLDAQTFRDTVFCRTQTEMRMPLRSAVRKCVEVWKSLPAEIRMVVKHIPRCATQGLRHLGILMGLPFILSCCKESE